MALPVITATHCQQELLWVQRAGMTNCWPLLSTVPEEKTGQQSFLSYQIKLGSHESSPDRESSEGIGYNSHCALMCILRGYFWVLKSCHFGLSFVSLTFNPRTLVFCPRNNGVLLELQPFFQQTGICLTQWFSILQAEWVWDDLPSAAHAIDRDM